MRIYAAVFAIVGWASVIGQYAVSNPHTLASTLDYFSYFTILSNVLVAATFTVAALAPQSAAGRFLLGPPVALATAVYITVTGTTYYVLLSSLYDLSGWELRFNHLLHYVMPPAFVLFWLAFVPKGTLRLRNLLWLLVPGLVYGAYTLAHGAVSGWYPYPFVDVTRLGYPRVVGEIVEFMAFFSLVGAVYVLIDWLIGNFRRTP